MIEIIPDECAAPPVVTVARALQMTGYTPPPFSPLLIASTPI